MQLLRHKVSNRFVRPHLVSDSSPSITIMTARQERPHVKERECGMVNLTRDREAVEKEQSSLKSYHSKSFNRIVYTIVHQECSVWTGYAELPKCCNNASPQCYVCWSDVLKT